MKVLNSYKSSYKMITVLPEDGGICYINKG